MGKQFGLNVTKADRIEICKYLLDQGYKFRYGIAYKTDELNKELTVIKGEPIYKYVWEFFELSCIDDITEVLKRNGDDMKNCFYGTTFLIYRKPLSEIEFYPINFSSDKTYNSCPMIEFSFRFWISSEAKGMQIWDDFDIIKRWMQKNFKYKEGEFVSE